MTAAEKFSTRAGSRLGYAHATLGLVAEDLKELAEKDEILNDPNREGLTDEIRNRLREALEALRLARNANWELRKADAYPWAGSDTTMKDRS